MIITFIQSRELIFPNEQSVADYVQIAERGDKREENHQHWDI